MQVLTGGWKCIVADTCRLGHHKAVHDGGGGTLTGR